jgi:hypothetical protein
MPKSADDNKHAELLFCNQFSAFEKYRKMKFSLKENTEMLLTAQTSIFTLLSPVITMTLIPASRQRCSLERSHKTDLTVFHW